MAPAAIRTYTPAGKKVIKQFIDDTRGGAGKGRATRPPLLLRPISASTSFTSIFAGRRKPFSLQKAFQGGKSYSSSSLLMTLDVGCYSCKLSRDKKSNTQRQTMSSNLPI